MADSMKYVKLKRSETCGFGFSILGGAGSELPPIIYDIIEGSPAANSCQLAPGDIIWEVNGQEVITFTTKEVLNCLRLSASEVTLKLKTDASIQQRVQQYLATPDNPDVLRTAITQDDLQGVKQIKAKKSSSRTPPEQSSSTPPSLPSPTLSDASDRTSISHGSNHTASENGLHVKDRTTKENERNKQKPKSEAYLMTEEDGTGKASVRTSSTTSPPLSEDESDIDSLHSFHYSPKAVDIPSAVRLAKRLITLDGFKKSDVSRHLSKNNEFSRAVAEEYLNYFDFRGDTLDKALRKFLDKFCLAGETQERERVLVHFSHRFLECNPGTFNSQDAVHTLTCALMLLNTDLHGQNVGRKMTCNEFIDNLADLNDGENFPREVLKSLYHAMRNQPLQWATDDDGDMEASGVSKSGGTAGDSQVSVGSNPFLAPPTGSGIQYKKGYIMRKCCTDPNGKKTAFGKRSWKMWFCVIQDLVLYLHKDEQGARRGPQHAQLGHNAIRLHHALATRAHDYSKKEHVFRLQTADQAEYLLQTSDSKELQAWIDTINLVAASLSAAPLPGAVGSQRKFQRPLLPCSITKLNLTEQLEDHTHRLAQLEQELEDHKAHPPEKNSKAYSMSNYREKEAYLIKEVIRYRTYVYLLRSRLSTQPPGQQGTGTGLDVGDLPVFEARPAGEGAEGGDRGARVIPPPIPERARPGDSPPPSAKIPSKVVEEMDSTTNNQDDGKNVVKSDDEQKAKDNNDSKEDGFDENGKNNKGTLKRTSREEKKLEKETEKFFKEVEKKEKKVEKKEKAREKKEKEKERKDKQVKKEKEMQTNDEGKVKEIDTQQQQNDAQAEGKKKEIKNVSDLDKDRKGKAEDKESEDPRIGTLNRLSALFRFSKLNTKNNKCEEEESVKDSSDPIEAPPLPPKPSPNSPIMKNIGTRIDI